MLQLKTQLSKKQAINLTFSPQLQVLTTVFICCLIEVTPILHEHFEGENTEAFLVYTFFSCPQEAASVGSRRREESLVRTVQEAHMTLLLSLHERYSPVNGSDSA